ncbi:MAG: hypothetical protein ACE14M_04770 [Terriglobales bacterium]
MESKSKQPPRTTSYSSDYEHSVEHWAFVRRLVEQADEQTEKLTSVCLDEKAQSDSAA